MAADSGMDTCPSPEIADSRKRPLDGDAENGDTKRSHFSSDGGSDEEKYVQGEDSSCNLIDKSRGDGTFHFKVLVPSVAAGAIIGKGGETIAQLQKETGARVKMSKSHDYYPGTTERVCLITGSVEAIMNALDFIMNKIREKPDLAKNMGDSENKMHERERHVKILVPNSTAGMIIGKAGNYIKQIKESSGSYVQISQKSKDISLQERCITVIGEKEQNKQACMMIMSKIVEDPQSGTCLNVSYADINGPVANFNPTGSPFANQHSPNAFNASTTSLNGGLSTAVSQGLLLNGGLNLSLNLSTAGQNISNVTAQLLDHIKMQLRTSGLADSQIVEICAALAVLAKYGVISVGLGIGQAHPGTLPNYLSVMEGAAPNPGAGVFGAIGQVSLGDCLAANPAAPRSSLERYESAFDPFRHQASAATAPISLNNNSFGLGTGQQMTVLSKSPTPADLGGPKDSKNVEIAEVIVGAILGPGGRSLVEIQQISGASIQISKKGIFAPGTRNRIVTITGNPHSINTAQYLIEQRISEEEIKRARNNGLGQLAIQ
ncbi:RNA-binding protein Pasilla isoform X1 [Diabrotica virgifera virgifera]|uniref:K Homology domain-containing protein n=1 Tax=Diabrotica virgifera virgifera TaxID=50390 RepID=A0ABM5KK58_DIAVI|nr:RNA-binding protein Pasilla isoform X1 [Diabrotica virgifera virgifera]XP_050510591.1 RNA-binding protein Pasilla isoform X1 [Diabrotica virgifera virgifera]